MAEASFGTRLIAHWRPLAGLLGLLIAANVALHLLVIRKDVRVSGDREAILAVERQGLGRLEDEVDSLERTLSKVACTRSDERDVFENLISGKTARMTAVLRELHQLAEEMKVEPGRRSFTRSSGEKTGLIRFSAAFSFDAPYRVLHEFIERVEGSPNFLFIEQVALGGSRRAGQDLRLNLRIATWFQGPDLERLDASLVAAGRRQ